MSNAVDAVRRFFDRLAKLPAGSLVPEVSGSFLESVQAVLGERDDLQARLNGAEQARAAYQRERDEARATAASLAEREARARQEALLFAASRFESEANASVQNGSERMYRSEVAHNLRGLAAEKGAASHDAARGQRAIDLLKDLRRTRNEQHAHREYMRTWDRINEFLSEEVRGTVCGSVASGARGVPDGKVCALKPGHDGDHHAGGGAVWEPTP